MRRAIVIVIGTLVAACNAIAGIEEGKLARSELVPDSPEPSAGGSSSDSSDSSDEPTSKPKAEESNDDCSCELPNAETSCRVDGDRAVCLIVACDRGYADCNNNPADGCETSLTDPTHCGSCTTACSTTAPLCISDKDSTACGTGCTDKAPTRCGDKCVDVQRDAKHCGACGNACPNIPMGKGKCEEGKCVVACDKGHHLCSGACVKDDSVEQCGPSCTPCPTAPNAMPRCAMGKCELKCLPGWANCDGDDSNGCETWLDSPSNCGACGRGCYYPYACISGKCL